MRLVGVMRDPLCPDSEAPDQTAAEPLAQWLVKVVVGRMVADVEPQESPEVGRVRQRLGPGAADPARPKIQDAEARDGGTAGERFEVVVLDAPLAAHPAQPQLAQ